MRASSFDRNFVLSPMVAKTPRSESRDWICPLLAVDADAFNHGGTSEFTAIRAVARRHNDISRVLTTTPDRFEPMHRRKPNGEVDPHPWCRGFYAAMRLRMSDWAPLLLPILLRCRDDQGGPLLGPPRRDRETREFLRKAHSDIPAVVEAMRQYWMPTRYARAS